MTPRLWNRPKRHFFVCFVVETSLFLFYYWANGSEKYSSPHSAFEHVGGKALHKMLYNIVVCSHIKTNNGTIIGVEV